MKSPLLAGLALVFALTARAADAGAPVSPVVIRELLADFLTHNSDPARHEKFWADDVVYTSAMGVVRTKPEIMANVQRAAEKVGQSLDKLGTLSQSNGQAGTVPPTYTAEDINIRPYNGFTALTFRLVARMTDGTVDTYRNSGTLIFRAGRWQVITWQATKVPPAEKR